MTDGPTGNDEWWTTGDVARALGLARGTVAAYLARGQMPAPDWRVGRTPLWRPATIHQWRDDRRWQPPAP